MASSPTLEYPRNSWLRGLFVVLPFLGLLFLANTVAHIGSLLFQKRGQQKEWQILLASTYHHHIIVCGLGHVGYRIVKNLLRNGLECVVIELQENAFAEEIRQQGVPVIVADARRPDALQQAGLPQAQAIIVATNDDLANLEIALDARSLQPNIRIVMRLFDEELARKIAKSFQIQCVFSTSAIAAPVFAAAVTDRNVINSFLFNEVQLNTVEITIKEKSQLIGWTLDRLRGELELTVALYQNAQEIDWNPAPTLTLSAGNKLLVITTATNLEHLYRLN
jgi:Trk K+ transport system NAD-binding subunit